METEKISVGDLVQAKESSGKWSGAEGTVVSLEMIEDRGDTKELWVTFKLDKSLNGYGAGSKVSFLMSEVKLVKPKVEFAVGDLVQVKEGRYDGWSGAEGTVFDYYGSGVGIRLTKPWSGQEVGSKVHFRVASIERVNPVVTVTRVGALHVGDSVKVVKGVSWFGAGGKVDRIYHDGTVGVTLTHDYSTMYKAGNRIRPYVYSLEKTCPQRTELEVMIETKQEIVADILKKASKALKSAAKEVREGETPRLKYTISNLIDAYQLLGQIETLRSEAGE